MVPVISLLTCERFGCGFDNSNPSRIKICDPSDNPPASERTLSITLTDGDGGTSIKTSFGITITPVNDVPTIDDISDPSALDEDTSGEQSITY